MQLSLDLYRVMTPYYQYRVAFFVITFLLNHIRVAFRSIWSIWSCSIQFDQFQCTYIIMIIDKFGLRAVAAPLVCEGGHMTTLTCQIFYFILFFLYLANIYIYIYIYVRTRFDLNPKQEWIQAHVAQTMNL